MLAVNNIKCQHQDKLVHHFSLAPHCWYHLEGSDLAAAASPVWWRDKWGCLNVRKEGWALDADRRAFQHYDVAIFTISEFIITCWFNGYSFLLGTSSVMTLLLVPARRFVGHWNLCFRISNPGKCLRMESCHPVKCVCDLCFPLAEAKRWKYETLPPSGGPAAHDSSGLYWKATVEKPASFWRYSQKRSNS